MTDRKRQDGLLARSARLCLAPVSALAGMAIGATAFVQSAAAQTAAEGAPRDWQLGFQDSATPVKAMMDDFHNLLLVVITAISLFVLALLAYVVVKFNKKANPEPKQFSHNTMLEVAWTLIPVLILIGIAVPSFRLLYYGDRAPNPELTLVVNGYQWYWGYEYPDQQIAEYASYMIPDEDIDPSQGQKRLLSVDYPVVLPVDTDIQILVTAGDVLHSWAMPSFGIKTDAITGRMNETWARIEDEGVYYGQCSEICGTGHGFMPIEVRAVSREAFDEWVATQVAGVEIDPENPPKLLTTTWDELQSRLEERQVAQN